MQWCLFIMIILPPNKIIKILISAYSILAMRDFG